MAFMEVSKIAIGTYRDCPFVIVSKLSSVCSSNALRKFSVICCNENAKLDVQADKDKTGQGRAGQAGQDGARIANKPSVCDGCVPRAHTPRTSPPGHHRRATGKCWRRQQQLTTPRLVSPTDEKADTSIND